jgi:hypothetical protein
MVPDMLSSTAALGQKKKGTDYNIEEALLLLLLLCNPQSQFRLDKQNRLQSSPNLANSLP